MSPLTPRSNWAVTWHLGSACPLLPSALLSGLLGLSLCTLRVDTGRSLYLHGCRSLGVTWEVQRE